MIKEVAESKVIEKMDSVIDCFVEYLGEKYKNIIYKKARNMNFVLVRGNGIVKLKNEQRYVGEEPVCLKDEESSYILFPVSFLADKYGNVTLAHLVMHAISEDVLSSDYSELSEIFVDYIANGVAKVFEKNNINVTFEENPEYESNSFYSELFSSVEKFYQENKNKVFDCLINGQKDLFYSSDIESFSLEIEEKVDKLLCSKISNEKKTSKR